MHYSLTLQFIKLTGIDNVTKTSRFFLSLDRLSVNELDRLMMLCCKWKINALKQRIENTAFIIVNKLIDKTGIYRNSNSSLDDTMQLIKFNDKYQIKEASKHLFNNIELKSSLAKLETSWDRWQISDRSRVRMMILLMEKDLTKVGEKLDTVNAYEERRAVDRMGKMLTKIYSYKFELIDITKPLH